MPLLASNSVMGSQHIILDADGKIGYWKLMRTVTVSTPRIGGVPSFIDGIMDAKSR